MSLVSLNSGGRRGCVRPQSFTSALVSGSARGVEALFNNWVSTTANEVQQLQTNFINSGSENKQLASATANNTLGQQP